ncbi:MAG TPA: diguanylate cyclase [Terriglobia bacterium]
MEKTRVLIAEDDPVSLRVVETMLKKWGYEPVSARDGDEAWKALQTENAPRLAILDWMMPRKDGPDVCRELRGQIGRPYTYVLLLTAKTQRRDLIDGLGAGADDYLTKPFSGEELRARLYSGERILAVQQQLMEAKEALRVQAIRDPLTGLYNRRYMEEALERELRRAEHGQHPLSVMMLDLDHFKTFNDTSGHQAGDHLLRYVGGLLEARTRREDIPCRYGGEEFVLILPGAPIEVAVRRAEQFRGAIRESGIEYEGKALGPVTVSIGVACFPQHGTTGAEVVGAADSALYRAKQQGRNRVIAYDPAVPPVQAEAPDALPTH